MNVKQSISNYIHNPFPLWNQETANQVIDFKWQTSLREIFHNANEYSIAGCIFKDGSRKEMTQPMPLGNGVIQISLPSNDLTDFYEEHGLVAADIHISSTRKVENIKNAVNILGKVKPLDSFIPQLVKSVQILEPENDDTDISYSHPDIPFSIFFSLCQDDSIISDLRVAESILHESMHLYLTLIENVMPLVEGNDKSVFYSPWRDEERPIRGVLHGLFVFRAILEFYTAIAKEYLGTYVHDYLSNRISEIKGEISLLESFPQSEGLTSAGQKLASMLLISVIDY